MITQFEIRRAKSKPFGRIEVHAPYGDTKVHGLVFIIGEQFKGYYPVRQGETIAIAYASRFAKSFAKAHKAKYIIRDGGKVRTV